MASNKLYTFFKINQALEVKAMLIAIILKERELIKEGESDNYDALAKVEKQLINLSRDITEGMLYIKHNGEDLPNKDLQLE